MRHGRSFKFNQKFVWRMSPVYWQASGSIAVTDTADASYINGGVVKTITITMVDINAAAVANASGLKWAWWDYATPNLITAAPTDKGTAGSTNGSGVCTLNLASTALASGQIGWLTITDSDGTTTQSPYHKAFSGPVAIN